MIEVGPWTFSEQDADALLRHTDELFGYQGDRHGPGAAEAVAPHWAAARAAVDAGDRPAAVATVWHELLAAGAALRSTGALGPPATGTVVHLATSDGGVPKTSVDRAEVGFRGVVGDRQASRKHHGRPFQALCLWSAELIEGLQAEGHPIAFGSAGENVTVRGLPWEQVVPGVQLVLGTVRCEVQAYATPCKQNARWFADRRFDRIHEKHGPVARVYATVVEPGAVAAGDTVELVTG